MPLPLGHAAIGLTAYDLCSRNDCGFSRWKLAFFIVLLANLPDIDILIGLLSQGNGNAFHRGPTHNMLPARLASVPIHKLTNLTDVDIHRAVLNAAATPHTGDPVFILVHIIFEFVHETLAHPVELFSPGIVS